jgi:hypothetical protein
MKKLLCTIAALMITGSAFGQGTVIFNNRLPTTQGGDQRIYLGGTAQLRGDVLNSMGFPGPGQGYRAGLYLVGAGGALTELAVRDIRFNAAGTANYFIDPITVNVTGVDVNQPATFRIRAWDADAANYDAAITSNLARGESNDVLVSALGGTPAGGGLPTADPYLEGLQEFNLFVPEPSVLTLGVLGAAGLLLRRRK